MATDLDASPPLVRTRIIPPPALRGVTWATYLALRDHPANAHLRMTYLDGTLTLMAPQFLHDKDARRLSLLVDNVTEARGIPCQGTATTTLQRPEPTAGRRQRGAAKEPDAGFYFGANEPLMRTKDQITLPGDPAPDLVIEVDHTRDSRRALAVLARLGVGEVWRHRTRGRGLWIGLRRADGSGYDPAERSGVLPRLTPALIALALAEADQIGETEWKPWIRAWARTLPEPPAPPDPRP